MGENFFHFCKEPEEEKGEEGKQASIYDVRTPQTSRMICYKLILFS